MTMWYFEVEALANEHRNDLLRDVAARRTLLALPPQPRRNPISQLRPTLARWRAAVLGRFGYRSTPWRSPAGFDLGRARRRYAAGLPVAGQPRMDLATRRAVRCSARGAAARQ
jgi:hypothetical protein